MGGRGVGLRRRGVGVRILVHTPEDFNNVCVLARTLEVLGVGTCFVYDPHRLIRPCYSKSYGRRLRTVLAGAFFRIRFERVARPLEPYPRARRPLDSYRSGPVGDLALRFRVRRGRPDPVRLRRSRAGCPREWPKPATRASRYRSVVPRRASTSASPRGSSSPSASGRPRAGPPPKSVPCTPPPDAVYRA